MEPPCKCIIVSSEAGHLLFLMLYLRSEMCYIASLGEDNKNCFLAFRWIENSRVAYCEPLYKELS